jgi:hypothetical protein
MAKSKKSIPTEPYECLDCDNNWDKKKWASKRCPNCGSDNTQPKQEAKTMEEPASEIVVEEEPEEKPKKKAAPKKVTHPIVTTMPKGSTMDVSTRSPWEQEFAELLSDVGIKQSDRIARIIMGSDKAEDPKYIDKQLQRYRVPLIQRQIILDFWCAQQGIEPPEVHGGDSEGAVHEESEFGKMAREMMDMFKFKMMSKMMMDDDGRKAPPEAPRRDPEPMVPMRDEEGNLVIDETTGQIVKVPASIYMAYQAQHNRQAPTQLDQFMEMMKYNMENQKMFIEMFGGVNKGPDPEMQAQLSDLKAKTMQQESDLRWQEKLDEMQAHLNTEQALKQQGQHYGQMLDQLEKQVQEMKAERERLMSERQMDYQTAQIEQARKSSDMAMEMVAEASKEFRATRRDVRELVTENMKNQQYVDQARGRLQTGQVQEVPLDAVGKDLERMEAAQYGPMGFGGQETIDYNVTAPETSDEVEDDEDVIY